MLNGQNDTELEQGTDTATAMPGDSTAAAEPKGSDPTKQAAEYEKTQQQLDQERSNRKRIQTALQEAQAEKDELAGQVTAMQGQMADLQKQLQESLSAKQMANLANLDPNTTDVPELVKVAQAQAAELKDLKAALAEAKQFIDGQKARQNEDAATRVHREMVEEIYSACDEEFGAQYRNEAVKLSDQWVDDGEVDAPHTPVAGLKLMRKAYAEVAKKHAKPDAKPKPHVPTDTGLRGLSVTDIADSEEFKPGTLDEVATDMAKKMKGGKWRKAFASSS